MFFIKILFVFLFVLIDISHTQNCNAGGVYCVGPTEKQKTIQEGVDAVKTPGDIVYIRSGTYTITNYINIDSSVVHGTKNDPIIITVYGSETVIIEADQTLDYWMLDIERNFWEINEGNGKMTFLNDGVNDVDFIMVRGNGTKLGPFKIDNRNTVDGEDHRKAITFMKEYNKGQFDGIVIEGIEFANENADYWALIYSSLYNVENLPSEITPGGYRVVIRNCVFGSYGFRGIYFDDYYGVLIENNYFNSLQTLEVFQAIVFEEGEKVMIRNNVLVVSKFRLGMIGFQTSDDVVVTNNFFYSKSTDQSVIDFDNGNSNVYIENNLFKYDEATGGNIRTRNTVNGLWVNDNWFEVSVRISVDDEVNHHVESNFWVNDIEINDIGVKPSPFYHHARKFPGKYYASRTPPLDFDGNPRSKNIPDAGAFELSGVICNSLTNEEGACGINETRGYCAKVDLCECYKTTKFGYSGQNCSLYFTCEPECVNKFCVSENSCSTPDGDDDDDDDEFIYLYIIIGTAAIGLTIFIVVVMFGCVLVCLFCCCQNTRKMGYHVYEDDDDFTLGQQINQEMVLQPQALQPQLAPTAPALQKPKPQRPSGKPSKKQKSEGKGDPNVPYL